MHCDYVISFANVNEPLRTEGRLWRHDAQHNDIQRNDTQHNNIKIKKLSINDTWRDNIGHNTKCLMLSAIMLNAVMLSVVMLNVVAPRLILTAFADFLSKLVYLQKKFDFKTGPKLR